MRQITFLLIAVATLAGGVAITALASRHAAQEAAQIFVTKIPPGYRDWRLISVAHEEGSLNDIRAILGNDVATKAFVLAFSHSLQHELADKGVRVQAVLPGATATEIWEIAGLSYQDLPAEVVMSAEDMVDAALVGLDQGEPVTIPPLQDGDEWTHFEAARRAISQLLRNSAPAPRYRMAAPRTA